MLVLAHLHRPVLTQQVHSLGHLAFKGRPSFAKALAKLSPNFREKSPNSFCKMKHTHFTINTYTYYIYLQYKFRHVYMNFRQNFSQKKISFAISEKNFSRDCSLHTQRLTQRKPLSWTFCSTLIYSRSKKCRDSTIWPSSSILNLFGDTWHRDKVSGAQIPTIKKHPPKFTLSTGGV